MAEEVEEEAEDILKGIRDLIKGDPAIYMTYPPEGGTKTIVEGSTELNIYTGEVFLADGTEEHLSDSLQRYTVNYARSLVIETNKEIKIQLDDGGKLTIGAGKIILWNNTKPFQRIMITATESTNIKVVVSNDPNMVLLMYS